MKMTNLILLGCIAAGTISCSSEDDKYVRLFHAVDQESRLYSSLTQRTESSELSYDGEEKYFKLLHYWQSVKNLRNYLVQAKTSLTIKDVNSLIESVKTVAPQRNQLIVLNQLAPEYLKEAQLIKEDLLRLRDLIIKDYRDLTQEDIDLSQFNLILDTKEQKIQFFGDDYCNNRTILGTLSGIATEQKCEDLVAKTDRYARVESISINGQCINIENEAGNPSFLDFDQACFTRVIHNNFSADTADKEAALKELEKVKLVEFYNDDYCHAGNTRTRLVAPYDYDLCGYIDYKFYDYDLNKGMESYSLGGSCVNYENSAGNPSRRDFRYACEILYTEVESN